MHWRPAAAGCSPTKVTRTLTSPRPCGCTPRAGVRSTPRAPSCYTEKVCGAGGAGPWAEQAGTELLATGETARKRDVSTADRLTPQELQIARFVSQGETNRGIATLLFLSPRTVDYHLRKIFAKLGLSSRGELMRMFLSDGAFAGQAP